MTQNNLHIILASKSPRRQALIKGLEYNFTVKTYEVDERFPEDLQEEKIAEYLAEKKADAYSEHLNDNEVLLTADTIVWVNQHVLNKPENKEDSFYMLKTICGNVHKVFTGVCLRSKHKKKVFSSCTEVFCKNLTDEEIWHYINQYQPFDKAGSYGIQDWFGYNAVQKINGCYYNVMGLPVSKIAEELKGF